MISIRTWFNQPPDDHILSSAASLICGRAMFAENRDWLRMLGLTPKPSWAEVWHVWTVIMPRPLHHRPPADGPGLAPPRRATMDLQEVHRIRG